MYFYLSISFVCLSHFKCKYLCFQSELLKSEIKDLQSEFETDRRHYLDTIREHEMQLKWFEAVIDRIQPTLRSGCNYINLDRIRAQSEWDDYETKWILPKLTVEKVTLPSTNSGEFLNIFHSRFAVFAFCLVLFMQLNMMMQKVLYGIQVLCLVKMLLQMTIFTEKL